MIWRPDVGCGQVGAPDGAANVRFGELSRLGDRSDCEIIEPGQQRSGAVHRGNAACSSGRGDTARGFQGGETILEVVQAIFERVRVFESQEEHLKEGDGSTILPLLRAVAKKSVGAGTGQGARNALENPSRDREH